MDNRTFGYARVSSKEQNKDRQIETKEISISQALQALNISRSSYYRLRQNNQI